MKTGWDQTRYKQQHLAHDESWNESMHGIQWRNQHLNNTNIPFMKIYDLLLRTGCALLSAASQLEKPTTKPWEATIKQKQTQQQLHSQSEKILYLNHGVLHWWKHLLTVQSKNMKSVSFWMIHRCLICRWWLIRRFLFRRWWIRCWLFRYEWSIIVWFVVSSSFDSSLFGSLLVAYMIRCLLIHRCLIHCCCYSHGMVLWLLFVEQHVDVQVVLIQWDIQLFFMASFIVDLFSKHQRSTN